MRYRFAGCDVQFAVCTPVKHRQPHCRPICIRILPSSITKFYSRWYPRPAIGSTRLLVSWGKGQLFNVPILPTSIFERSQIQYCSAYDLIGYQIAFVVNINWTGSKGRIVRVIVFARVFGVFSWSLILEFVTFLSTVFIRTLSCR